MGDRASQPLFESSIVGVFDVTCHAPRSEALEDEHAAVTQLVFPRRGLFEVHRRRDSVTADPSSVVILEAGEDHRIDHPVSGGDRSTVFVFPAELLDEAFRERVRWGGVLRPGVVMGSRLLRAMLRKGTPDGLETEELSLLLLEGLARDPVFDAAYGGRSGSGPRRRVERVRALLASRPGATWRLHDIALAVHCSPYHLARQFREVTGESVSRYLLQLRLAVALDRISEGEQDLAGLAADLGFAHHSHLSARFRSVFGMSPSSARDSLTTGRPEEMRTIVTAARPDAS